MELVTSLTLPNVEKDQLVYVQETGDLLFLILKIDSSSSTCPKCNHATHRRHSRYTRLVNDLAYAERTVTIQLMTNKWFCDHPDCDVRVFTERIPWLKPYGRRTNRLEKVIESIAFSTNCLAAEKICRSLHIPISHDAILQSVKKRIPTIEKPGGFPFRRD